MAHFWPRMHKWNLLGRGILGVLSSSDSGSAEPRKKQAAGIDAPFRVLAGAAVATLKPRGKGQGTQGGSSLDITQPLN